jgi:hypothetical protein
MNRRFGRAERSGAAGEPVGVRVRAPRTGAGIIRRIAKIVVAVLVVYYVFCLLLLVAYRFTNPPTTGVQVQRRVEALLMGRDYAKERSSEPPRTPVSTARRSCGGWASEAGRQIVAPAVRRDT